MPDSMGMNITHHIQASLILGSVLVASSPPVWAEEQGVGSVELVEFPFEGIAFTDIDFSDDGQTIVCISRFADSNTVYLYEGELWKPVYAGAGSQLFPTFVAGISDDGGTILLTDIEDSFLYREGVFSKLTDSWIATDRRTTQTTLVQGAAVSGDGSTVALIGDDRRLEYDDVRSFLWNGESRLEEISIGDPDVEDFGYRVEAVSQDGSAFLLNTQGRREKQVNNVRINGRQLSFLWEEGSITQLPEPDVGYDVSMDARAMSLNQAVVVGNGYIDSRHVDQVREYGDYRSWERESFGWIWDRATGATQDLTSDRFESGYFSDVSGDGSIALGDGVQFDGSGGGFLWVRDQGIVMLDQLFDVLKIDLHADSYTLQSISNDGRRLYGIAYIEDQVFALTVTIPDLTP